MKASDFIARFLERKGISHVFELSGGMITHLLDSLQQSTKINIITMHHEQAAAFAADAFGRISGLPGVALATSGPGATNLLTGIGSCYFDSSPAIFITGQVNTHEQKRDRNIRQLGFQETDIVSMALPITKASFRIEKAEDIPEILEMAFSISMEGRPGPVLIDIPMDMQRAAIQDDFLENKDKQKEENPMTKTYLTEFGQLANDIQTYKRPVILVGRGVRAAFAANEFSEFLELTGLPVITSLLAVDAIPYKHKQRIGFIGSYGNRWANIAFGEADLIIVLGSRLDIRQTGADTKFFENGKKIYHVDCEEAEINNRIKGCVPIIGNVKDFLNIFNELFSNENFLKKFAWFDYINELKKKWPDTKELNTANNINPNKFIHLLSSHSENAATFLADVGAHQMWTAQSIEINEGQTFITSAGMGAMGFALPAAVGACFANGKKPVVTIIGDGCMQLNLQELQTIIRNKIPVKIIVLNNQSLGMITQFQASYFDARYQSTYWGYSAPNFEKIAIAYGLAAKTISKETEIVNAVEWLWNEENLHNPVLLQVMIAPFTNTYPKIAFGKPITEMEPFVKPIEMEGT